MARETTEASASSMVVVVREYDPARDLRTAEAFEEMCESSGHTVSGAGLITHLRHPASRISHSPCHIMLLAEIEEEMVGLIRGCIKTATCGKKMVDQHSTAAPVLTKLAYIMGLRVHPSYRRLGIATSLVRRLETWFTDQGAEYSYMATDKNNKPSLHLFTDRLSYSKFRTPSILVHPVFAHRRRSSSIDIVTLSPDEAKTLYRAKLSTTEFFPHDIDRILHNPLSVGTFLAVDGKWRGVDGFLSSPPSSWAVASVWDVGEVFTLEVRGAPKAVRAASRASRALDRAMPWLRIPSVPDLFRPFGAYFVYGVGGGGARAAAMLRRICGHAHDMAREAGRAVVAAEVGACEPLRDGIPHWRRLSVAEDVWCLKRLAGAGAGTGDGDVGDWIKSLPPPSIFVDPREL